MTIQQFIEAAIEGGYVNNYLNPKDASEIVPLMIQEKHMILLDPKAWEAVYKAKGINIVVSSLVHQKIQPAWQLGMHMMIDALAEGETLEEYIATL